ncbi:MAG: delta-class carbonic anhydrase [Mariprofundaceae bacterium]|nr:delta-class carbonic anhydrase [Mariprofundaceae bacterium]
MKHMISMAAALMLLAAPALASEHGHHESAHAGAHGGAHAGQHATVADKVIAEQRKSLAKNTKGKGFGPQSPRDIDAVAGKNKRIFSEAPASTKMNLCNIHFHKNAEHKAKDFGIYAGNGNGQGYQSGYKYDTAKLSAAKLAPVKHKICDSAHSSLSPGDTIEVHYVYTTAQVKPGPTLASCLSEAIKNPQLRVETQVYVLVNDKHALSFKKLTKYKKTHGLYQATGIPSNTGMPVQYEGSTTGPGYNEKGSPFQVSWRVRPQVAKVNIATVGKWCEKNVFKEDHGHGVRNLVMNPDLLSEIN